MDGRAYGWMAGPIHGWIDGQIGGSIGGWKDRETKERRRVYG